MHELDTVTIGANNNAPLLNVERENDQFPILLINERVQAGDVFLFRFNCPRCKGELFESLPFGELACCGYEAYDHELKIGFRRMIVGVRRKQLSNSKILVRKILEKYNGLCTYCGNQTRSKFHIDHILALACGGTNDFSNLCLSCPECNELAHAKYFTSIETKRQYILIKKKHREVCSNGVRKHLNGF